MTIFINLGQGYGYNCDLDHLQDVYLESLLKGMVVLIMMIQIICMVIVILI